MDNKPATPEDIARYIRGLDSSSYQQRLSVAERLASIGEDAVPQLLDALKSESWMVRQDSADILGRIGGLAAIQALEPLLEDLEDGVRACAQAAIGKIIARTEKSG